MKKFLFVFFLGWLARRLYTSTLYRVFKRAISDTAIKLIDDTAIKLIDDCFETHGVEKKGPSLFDINRRRYGGVADSAFRRPGT